MVAVVLDASGSMLQRIGNERRIDIAKQAVGTLVRDVLPAGVGFSLRVFGHKEADSCRTDLEMPAAPLDRMAAAAKIASIQAMNLAKTPIGESLRLTAADLAGRPPPHLIILVTDGEETCGGDAAAAIRELRARRGRARQHRRLRDRRAHAARDVRGPGAARQRQVLQRRPARTASSRRRTRRGRSTASSRRWSSRRAALP